MARIGGQRLSKLQKWILENCYRVTVLLDRSALRELKNLGTSRKCRDCAKSQESVCVNKGTNGFITHRCLNSDDVSDCYYFKFYKEDILLSFFSLTPNNEIAHINRVQHFQDSPDYAKAHVTVHRSINNLAEKGFIFTHVTFREDSLQIHLTGNGVEKAAELLGISGYESLIGP